MSSNFDITTLSCDQARDALRFASTEELTKLVPQLTEAQLEYVLATLPKRMEDSVNKILSGLKQG